MLEFGQHSFYILASYGAAAVILLLMIFLTLFDARAARLKRAALEKTLGDQHV